MIRQDFLNSSLANFKLKICVAIISCFARSLNICDNSHPRSENCTSICLPIDNSKFSLKSITFSDKVFLHFNLKKKQFLPQIKNKLAIMKLEDISGPLLIIPEEHNIPRKFKDDHLPDDHAKLLKSYKADLSLPLSPILPENHCSKKLLKVMTRDDKVIWDLIKTIKTKRPMGIHGSYMKSFAKDLHIKDDLLFLDNKLVVPATIRSTFSAMLHETHPG